jgi:hypothetical protein
MPGSLLLERETHSFVLPPRHARKARNLSPIPFLTENPAFAIIMALPPALVPAILPPPVPVPRVVTYSEKYATDIDPYHGDYTALLAGDVPIANGPSAADTLAAILASNDLAPKVFLCLVGFPQHPHVTSRTFFRPFRYPPMPGLPTPWDYRVFVHASDVLHGSTINTFELPPMAFGTTDANARALDHASITAAFAAAAADAYLLNPIAAANPAASATITRFFIRVPPRYIPIVLGRRLTPRELWTQLGQVIIADGNEISCAPLLAWLRLSCSTVLDPADDPANPVLPVHSPLTCIGLDSALTRPEPDEPLFRHRWALVTTDLPDLLTPTTPPPAPHFAGLLHAFRDDRLADREAASAERELDRASAAAARIAAAAAKRPSEAFAAIIDRLLASFHRSHLRGRPPSTLA